MELTNRVLEEIKSVQPIQIILIDYPGFNLRLAKKIKKRFNISITYYISPQLWAWKEGRIEIVRRCIEQMLVIFPFEENWYKERGIRAKFVGHPIFDEWTPTPKYDLCKLLGLNPDYPILTLFSFKTLFQSSLTKEVPKSIISSCITKDISISI